MSPKWLICIVCSLFLFLTGCGGGGGGSSKSPTTGNFAITVVNADPADPATPEPIQSASIDIYDDSNAFVIRGTTDSNGMYTAELSSGAYTVRVSAQGYNSAPSQGISGVPTEIVLGTTVEKEVALRTHSSATATAQISGSTGVAGTLVVAYDSTTENWASALSDADGNFTLFNVEPGNYDITAFKAGNTSDTINTVADVDGIYTDQNLTVETATNSTLSGSITFLAGENGVVDITLLHPVTMDTIPGLVTENLSQDNSYTLEGVPDGDFLAWASFENDGYIVDQDWIIKNGGFPNALELTISSANQTKDFSVTDTVPLVSPTNDAEPVIPVEVDTLTPTFTWQTYPGTQQWAIEVFDSDGNTIWGGFDGVNTIGHTTISKDTLSVQFDFDGSASEALEDGKTYRWKVLSLKDGTGAEAGTLVIESASEDQLGLFKVVLPSMP